MFSESFPREQFVTLICECVCERNFNIFYLIQNLAFLRHKKKKKTFLPSKCVHKYKLHVFFFFFCSFNNVDKNSKFLKQFEQFFFQTSKFIRIYCGCYWVTRKKKKKTTKNEVKFCSNKKKKKRILLHFFFSFFTLPFNKDFFFFS